ncbi:MAG TPA: hypothetical protein PKK95_09200, partial [Vicinamibacterales bacterium]|nr:hypothetical protein [Vicinamibacterales bacterium]
MSDLRQFRVTLTTPDGLVHDLTDRTDLDSFGQITEELEEDLGLLTHSDMDVEFFDEDGVVSGLLEGAVRGQVFELVVERETGLAEPQWKRVFAGVLDVPGSIHQTEGAGTVSLQVFAYSKLLELHSAEAVRRTVEDRTGTVSAGSRTVTVSDTTDLAAGDEITLDGGGESETQTIRTVDSSTQVTTLETWTNAFTAAPLTLETPYYRSQSVTTLAGRLAAEAGLTDVHVDIAQQLAELPFPTDMNDTGLPSGSPAGLLERSSDIAVYAGGNRYDAADQQSGFTGAGADTVKCDWRPYALTEPATLRAASGSDTGGRAWDYAGGDYYELALVGSDLKLRKNGVAIATVVTLNTYDQLYAYGLDWCP